MERRAFGLSLELHLRNRGQVVDFKPLCALFMISVDNFVDRPRSSARGARKIKALAGMPAKAAWKQA
jgi:hypothetical protein